MHCHHRDDRMPPIARQGRPGYTVPIEGSGFSPHDLWVLCVQWIAVLAVMHKMYGTTNDSECWITVVIYFCIGTVFKVAFIVAFIFVVGVSSPYSERIQSVIRARGSFWGIDPFPLCETHHQHHYIVVVQSEKVRVLGDASRHTWTHRSKQSDIVCVEV